MNALQTVTRTAPFDVKNYVRTLYDDVQTLILADEERKHRLDEQNFFRLKMVEHNLRLAQLNNQMADLTKGRPLTRELASKILALTKIIPENWILSISLAQLILYRPALSRLQLSPRDRRDMMKNLVTQKALNIRFLSTQPNFWPEYLEDLRRWTAMKPSPSELLQKIDLVLAAAFSHVPVNGLSENEIQFLVHISDLIPKQVRLEIPSKLFMSPRTFFPWHAAQFQRAHPRAYSKLQLILGK